MYMNIVFERYTMCNIAITSKKKIDLGPTN